MFGYYTVEKDENPDANMREVFVGDARSVESLKGKGSCKLYRIEGELDTSISVNDVCYSLVEEPGILLGEGYAPITFYTEFPKSEKERKYEQLVREGTLMTDVFTKYAFEGNIEAVEHMLSQILDMNLTVLEVNVQSEIPGAPKYRSVRLDIKARDFSGKLYNIEFQNRNDDGASYKRAVYNASMILTHTLEAGTAYEDSPTIFVIFITGVDKFKLDRNKYEFVFTEKYTGIQLEDTIRLVYVNGSKKDDSKIGRLVKDLSTPNPNEISALPLRRALESCKAKERRSVVMDFMEKWYEEGEAVGQAKLLLKLYEKGKTVAEIAGIFDLEVDYVQKLLDSVM